MSAILAGLLMGLVATALMDVWALILNRFAGQNLPNWALVGRWFRHLGEGTIFHDDIAKAEPYGRELALGWIGHYVIGIIYGIVFAILAGPAWLAAPTFLPAWIFAILTVTAGWFLLQPGLGLGWAASKTANPGKVRALNLVAHTVFGMGMWGTALLLRG